MKYLIILTLMLSSCATSKRTKPCQQCPHYTYNIGYQYLYLNPYPLEIAYEKPD